MLTETAPIVRLASGLIRRAIAILQSRGSAHDQAVRQVFIDGDGMHISDSITNVTGILNGASPSGSGSPPYLARPLDQLNDD